MITQRFKAVERVKHIGPPLLVVHGCDDHAIQPGLARKLYVAATAPKCFVLVGGG